MPGTTNVTRDATDVVVLSPVYNDWSSVRLLLPRLDAVLVAAGVRARVVLVNDDSTETVPSDLIGFEPGGISHVTVVSLRRNLGHQRAIAVGLAYVCEHVACSAVVLMDADGEDRPEDVPRLLDEFHAAGEREIVFARRTRRSEGFTFTTLYRLYRALHRILTGIPVQVGNFSVIPFSALHRLVVVSDLWNHYAAAVFQSRLPFRMVPTVRGRRLTGASKMNLVSLVGHGLSAIAVFADRVGVRVLMASLALLALTLLGGGVAALRWLLAGQTVPPWTIAIGVLVVAVLLQAAAGAALFVLLVLFGRPGSTFIPSRDYRYFVLSDDCLFRSPG